MRRRALLAASQTGGGGDAVIIEFTIAGNPLEPGGYLSSRGRYVLERVGCKSI